MNRPPAGRVFHQTLHKCKKLLQIHYFCTPTDNPHCQSLRRGGRAVDCGGLENRCAGNRTEGSNPSLSANDVLNDVEKAHKILILWAFFISEYKSIQKNSKL